MSNVTTLEKATPEEQEFVKSIVTQDVLVGMNSNPNFFPYPPGPRHAVAKEALRIGDDPNVAGVKFDQGKARLDLVPVEGVNAVGEILGVGAQKYGDRNWEKGMDWSRPYGACLRHLFAWWSGEDRDPDTGKSHLWHAACNIFFLIAYEKRGKGKDDRPKIAA